MAFCDLEKYYSALKNNYFSMLHILEQYDEGRKTGAVTDKEFKRYVMNQKINRKLKGK